jgi:hypothetical protein
MNFLNIIKNVNSQQKKNKKINYNNYKNISMWRERNNLVPISQNNYRESTLNTYSDNSSPLINKSILINEEENSSEPSALDIYMSSIGNTHYGNEGPFIDTSILVDEEEKNIPIIIETIYRTLLSFNTKKVSGKLRGKVSSAAINIGSTKGIGSSSRILTNCQLVSEEPSLCVNEIISAPIPDVLFNKGSLDNFVIEEKYKKALLVGISRWEKFIKYNPEVVELIRKNLNRPSWNGLEMVKFEIINEPNSTTIASAGGYLAKRYTSLIYGFNLTINMPVIQTKSQKDLEDIMTHEIGHALGFNITRDQNMFLPTVTENAQPNGRELLPRIVAMDQFVLSDLSSAFGLSVTSYRNAVAAYRSYGLTREYVPTTGKYSKVVDSDKVTLMILDKNWNGGPHLSNDTYYSLECLQNTIIPKYLKLGIDNEIMLPEHQSGKRYYISKISIGFLLDLYSNLDGKNYFTYIKKNDNSEAGSSKIVDRKIIFIPFK